MEDLNLYQKLAKIRKSVEIMQKNKAGFNYKYVSEDAILLRVASGMDKLHVSLIPSIVPGSMNVSQQWKEKTKSTRDGKMYNETVGTVHVYGEMIYTWVNNDNPEEKIEVPWFMVGGQEDASRSFGSALTYANRYFLLKFFNISTSEDDPDAVRKTKDAAEAENDKALAAEIVKTIDKLVKGFVAANPDKAGEIKEICSKYCKGGNYFSIKEQTLAAALLDSVSNFIEGTGN